MHVVQNAASLIIKANTRACCAQMIQLFGKRKLAWLGNFCDYKKQSTLSAIVSLGGKG